MSRQAGFIAILTVILLLIGAAVGAPGRFPVVDGAEITPEFLWNLAANLVVPLVALAAVIFGLFKQLAYREYAQDLNRDSIIALLRLPEFLLAVVASIVFVVQTVTGVTLMDEATQAMVANAILVLIGVILNAV